MDPADPSQVDATNQVGFPQRGMYYGATYFDAASNTMLLEMVDEYGDFHGVATGPVCSIRSRRRPDVLLERVMLVDDLNPHLSACGEDCLWSAFGMYEGRVYFVMAGQYGLHASDLDVVVTLRVLEGCEHIYPIKDDNRVRKYGDHFLFAVNRCSSKIADVLNVPLSANSDVKTGKYLAIDSIDNEQVFYFQVAESEYIGGEGFRITTTLYRVWEHGDVGVVDHHVDKVGIDRWERRVEGGVAAAGRVVCHAVFGVIRCLRGGLEFETIGDGGCGKLHYS